jgi:hypothetical protein
MRFGVAFVLPWVLAVSAWSQLTFTIPVQDKSGTGNPLEISGTISFSENVVLKSITTSADYEVKARNHSDKPIVLIVATFDESGPHGGSRHHILQFDDIFRLGISPGQSFVLSRSDRTTPAFCCVDPQSKAEQPRADVRVVFVQFSDGSTFGDKAAAKNIFEIQAAVLDRLRTLDDARSDEEFLRLLRKGIEPDEAEAFFEAIRRTQKEKGTSMARGRVRSALINSEKHVAQLTVEQAGGK